ncbi:MAG: alpha/beta fold hydrolase, partial [Dehalococcoidia bacterium]
RPQPQMRTCAGAINRAGACPVAPAALKRRPIELNGRHLVRSATIQTSDLRTHYLQAGTGEPVILLHGFPETSYEWRRQIPALAERYAVFAPDNRGFGGTDKPEIRVSRSLLAQDVVNAMDALGIERAAVVGHDWGGIIAFKLAIDWPERVTRLALLDTLCTVWAQRAVHGYWFKAKPLPEEFFAAYHRQFIEAIFAGTSDPALPPRPASPWRGGGGVRRWATAENIEHYAAAFADPASHRAAISYYRYALPFHRVIPDATATHGERFEALDEQQVAAMWLHPDGLEQHPLHQESLDYGPEDRHKRFTKPVLWMMAGAGASPENEHTIPHGHPFVDQFSRYFPDLRAQRVNAGHFFPEEAPDVTNAALLRFLAAPS